MYIDVEKYEEIEEIILKTGLIQWKNVEIANTN